MRTFIELKRSPQVVWCKSSDEECKDLHSYCDRLVSNPPTQFHIRLDRLLSQALLLGLSIGLAMSLEKVTSIDWEILLERIAREMK